MQGAVEEHERFLEECRRIRYSDCPITLDPGTGACTVYRYDDVANALRNYEVFSNTPPGARFESQYAMLFTDPPRHRELRTLVSKAFTPRAIARLEDRLETIVDGLIGDVPPAGEADLTELISVSLPLTMIAEMLGVDSETRQSFKRWANSFTVIAVSQSQAHEGLDEHVGNIAEMFEYFDEIIADRRKEPRDDLITALIQAEEAGQRLSEAELKSTFAQLLAAGDETTTNFIGNCIICLAERPAVLESLREDPSLMGNFLEEVLRFLSPSQCTARYANAEVELYGHIIKPGVPVVAHNGAANRDEAYFADPDDFNVRRDASRHLAFGFGIHFCLGAALARLETKVAIRKLIHALKGEWTITGELTRLPERPFFFGVRELPMSWGGIAV